MTTEEDQEISETSPNKPPPCLTTATAAELGARFYHVFASPHRDGDLLYFSELLSGFGDQIDLMEEMMRFQAWSLDKGDPVRYPRAKLRDWLLRSRKFGHRGTATSQPKRH